ncbi:MAG: hypothetical protein K2M34_04680, partial [Alphaproteobacteria bacterium]|nr:hypothetical protein [Alphaproteobacteria bacterium]
MANKNYDDMSDDGIRFIGCDTDRPQGYFCRAFAATCPCFENTGLCTMGDCYYADKNIPSADEMLRLQLIQIRRTQLQMAQISYRDRGIKVPWHTPKT